ncbi:DNA alkylation repair enzyme [uncultured archaeon]|nr:DNA alkylation repair enzyme [uncultured archaeon]
MSTIFLELKAHSNSEKAEGMTNYFKHEIKSLGVPIPIIRNIVKKAVKLDLENEEILKEAGFLWNKDFIEARLAAIFLLEYSKLTPQTKFTTALIFLKDKNLNWALSDAISGSILGRSIVEDKTLLPKLLPLIDRTNWEKRACIVGLMRPMWRNVISVDFLLKLVAINLYSEWEYSQKACGWVLRECYKKNGIATKKFMARKKNMPRITFSYACERMTEKEKLNLKKLVYS